MSPRARVVVLGEDVPAEPAWEVVPVSDGALAIDPQPQAPILLIAGDGAIDALAPGELPRPRHDTLCVFLAPLACSYVRLAAWLRDRPCTVHPPEGLRLAVAERLRRGLGVRQNFEPQEWYAGPLDVGSAAWSALRALPDVEVAHDIEEWAKRMGWPRQTLWEVCIQALGKAPRELALLHVRAQARQARARGFSRLSIAHALGYCDASSLSHALNRRRSSAG